MEEERPEGASHTTPEISHESPGSDPQETSKLGEQAGSTLQQVAQEASKSADQPGGFEIYGEENASHRLPLNSSEQDLQRFPKNDPSITTTVEAPTASLAAIAGDTATLGHTTYGRVPMQGLEAGQHIFVDNAESWIDANVDGAPFGGSPQNDASSAFEWEQKDILAFGKLELVDGEYYINTYATDLGRDMPAAQQAADLQARQGKEIKSRKRRASVAGSITSSQARHRITQNSASSIVSEDGGVVAVDTYKNVPTRKSRPQKSKSRSSTPQQISRKSSVLLCNGKKDYNALALASLGLEYEEFGPNNQMPAPELVPLIPICPPPLPQGAPSAGKAISRKHIRIAYDFDESVFEIQILGRNGVFVDDEYYAQGDVQTLTNGSIIQIGGVGIRFVLPDVGLGETGAETPMSSDPLSGGKMNFDMADSNEGGSSDDIDEDEEHCRGIKKEKGDEEKEDEDEDMDVEEEEEDVKEEEEEEEEEEAEEPQVVQRRARGKKKPEPEPESLPTPKRKGPGRPPKNGIISKREQALLARQAREKAKVVAERGSGALKDLNRVKAGKDKKIVKKEQPLPQTNGKRKYTKRKRATDTNDQRAVRESTEQTDSVPPEQSIAAKLPPKPAKEKKPPKPPRSPSPVFDEATLTPEQLVKPPQNYIVLIHEALSNSETGAMALPQIYRAMQRKYPYFKLRATTVGWQSSVRHNLGQNPAFRKIERDGKGWMWGLVPGVSIEREKKRRATPPPVSQQPYYPPGPPPMQYPYSYPGMPPPTGHIPPTHYGMPPRMPPAQLPHGLPPRGPHGFPLPLVNAQSESTYQSPYQSTPPSQQSSAPVHTPQGNSTPNGINGHYPNTTSQPPLQASDNKHQSSGPASSPLSALHQVKSEALTSSLGKSTSDADDEGAVQAIARYKSDYIDSMPDKAKAEILVTSAINRTLGISNPKAAADEAEDPHEKEIMSEIATMLSDLSKKSTVTQRRGSDDTVPSSKPSPPAPVTHGSASSLPAVAPTAAGIEAKSPLANGDAHGRNGAVEREAAAEDGGGRKRPLENGDGPEHGQPEAKRVALEASD